jgi:hypothetical protein
MKLRIRSKARFGSLIALIAGVWAPVSATAQDHLFSTTSSGGSFSVSLSEGTLTGSGYGHGRSVGWYDFELNLALTPSPDSPLSRVVVGDVTYTTRSGDQLRIRVAGTITYDPNTNSFGVGELSPCEVLGGTGRFATATGTGTFALLGWLDDSGVRGYLAFGVEIPISLR